MRKKMTPMERAMIEMNCTNLATSFCSRLSVGRTVDWRWAMLPSICVF
jgi:hypothetical protein